ncbi:hypothetical protein AYI69_g6252 [Smittium culicis]|uniref:Uncharacterized protein n=1 Tax=Smittium culicis TaxID=133412 RepID=A0A1R1Y068_9FUNG|nr:hypothetical protein AYI69_g6252 [Smittium culicis]
MVMLNENTGIPNGLDLYLIFSKLYEGMGEPGNMVASLLISKSYYWGALISEAAMMKESTATETSDLSEGTSPESELESRLTNVVCKDLYIPSISKIKPDQEGLYNSWINGSYTLPTLTRTELCDEPSETTKDNMRKRLHIYAFRTVFEDNSLTCEQWYQLRNRDKNLATLVYGISRIMRGIKVFSNTVSKLEMSSFDFSKLKSLLAQHNCMDETQKGVNSEKFRKIIEAFKKIEIGRLSLVKKHLKDVI